MKKLFVFFLVVGLAASCKSSDTLPETPAVTPAAHIVIENVSGVILSINMASVTGTARNSGNADAALVHVYVTIEGTKSDGTTQDFEAWNFVDHPDIPSSQSSNFTVYFDDSSHAIHHLTNLIVKSTSPSWSKPGAQR